VSSYDFSIAEQIHRNDPPFKALIMAAILKADEVNKRLLKVAFPDLTEEVWLRYNSPGGRIETDWNKSNDIT